MKELTFEWKTVLCTGSMSQFSLNAIMTPTLDCNAVAFTNLQSEPFSVQSFEDKIELAAPFEDFSEHIPMEFLTLNIHIPSLSLSCRIKMIRHRSSITVTPLH